MITRISLSDRFWSKVRKTATCWEWLGAVGGHGYGNIGEGGRCGKTLRAHRVAYELLVGAVPNGTVLDHVCHNKLCVNPAHLRIATAAQNLANSVIRKDNKLRCKGVRKIGRAYQVRIMGTVLGSFSTLEGAKAMYDAAGRLQHGMFFNDGANMLKLAAQGK